MIKLTQQQIAILASAQARPDGCATRPANLKPAAAAKSVAKLIEQGLMRELRAKGDAPVWREDEGGKCFSLKLLKAGRTVLAVAPQSSNNDGSALHTDQPIAGLGLVVAAASGEGARPSTDVGSSRSSASSEAVGMDAACTTKARTKRSLILSLMGRDGGATLHELVAATGWLPHTTRAALTGLRKSGIQLERAKRGDVSAYQVIAAPTPAVA